MQPVYISLHFTFVVLQKRYAVKLVPGNIQQRLQITRIDSLLSGNHGGRPHFILSSLQQLVQTARLGRAGTRKTNVAQTKVATRGHPKLEMLFTRTSCRSESGQYLRGFVWPIGPSSMGQDISDVVVHAVETHLGHQVSDTRWRYQLAEGGVRQRHGPSIRLDKHHQAAEINAFSGQTTRSEF